MREAQAYNSSIYLMVGMPYLMLSVLGFVVYRGVQRHNAAGHATLPQAVIDKPTLLETQQCQNLDGITTRMDTKS